MTWVSVGLAVLWAALLLGSLLPGRRERQRTTLRLASSGVLALAAWIGVAVSAGHAWVAYSLPVAVGMSFGLLGDLFMARVLPARNYTLAGMGAFAFNHAAYWAAFVVLIMILGIPWWPRVAVVVVIWLVAGAAVWRWTAGGGSSPMRWPALIYTLLLAGTAGLGLGLAVAVPSLAPLAVGGALFFLSDALIAARLFRGWQHRHLNDLIWLTYGPAQMLIVYGLAAWRISGPTG